MMSVLFDICEHASQGHAHRAAETPPSLDGDHSKMGAGKLVIFLFYEFLYIKIQSSHITSFFEIQHPK